MKKSVSLDCLDRNGVWHWRSGFSARLVPGLQISSCSPCWIGLFGGVERICRPWGWSEWNPKFHEQVLVEAGLCFLLGLAPLVQCLQGQQTRRPYQPVPSQIGWHSQVITEETDWPLLSLQRRWIQGSHHCLNRPSSRTYLLKASLNVWIQQLPIAEGFTRPQVSLSRFWDLSSSGPWWLCGFVFKGPQEMPCGSSSPNSGLCLGLGVESWMLFSSAEPCSSQSFWWMLLLGVRTGQL